MEEYDAIIIGAGPAGLLLGKELSKKHKILILEKGKLGESKKSWVTYEDRWRKEGLPEKFITNRFNEWRMQNRSEKLFNEIVIPDTYVCVDEHALLEYLSGVVENNGSVVLYKTPFNSFQRVAGSVIVNRKYQSKLVIDCTGIESFFAKKFNLDTAPLNINTCGYLAEFDKIQNKNYYQQYKKPHSKNFLNFGATKVGPRKGLVLYLEYSDKTSNPSSLKNKLDFMMKINGVKPKKILEDKSCSYPMGIIKKRSLDNVILFGDAGFYSPCFIGMGFNEVLRQYKLVSKHIHNAIKNNKYSEKDLKLPDNVSQEVDNLFFRFFGLIYNSCSVELMSELFDVAKKIPKRDWKRIFRNEVTDRDVIVFIRETFRTVNLGELIRAMKKHHLKYILKTLWELDKDLITEEIHNLVFKHHKFKIKDMYS